MSKRLLLALFALACAGSAAPAAEPESVKIGMLQGMFRDIHPAMVTAMAKPLRDLIERQTGLTGDVEVLDDYRTLAERLTAKKLQLGVFHGFEFARVRADHPDLVPLLITVPPARKLQAIVVVRDDCKAKSLADLDGEQVLIPRGTKAHCLLYLDGARVGFPAGTAKPQTKSRLTAEEAIDEVVLGDASAVLLDASALLGYKNLQPGSFKSLRVLCESPTFPPTVLATTKGSLTEGTVTKIRDLLVGASQSAAGKPLLMLWNINGFETVPATYDADLTRIAREFPEPKAKGVPAATVGLAKPEN
jgi:ABC-type phosphate/phosphonate transport system substrate-binding protein